MCAVKRNGLLEGWHVCCYGGTGCVHVGKDIKQVDSLPPGISGSVHCSPEVTLAGSVTTH